MGHFDHLDALSNRQAAAQPKPEPTVLAKAAKKKSRDEQAAEFRAAVWKRDEGKSRATGKPLVKSGTINADELGEVDHVINRSVAPDRIFDVSNGILLSKRENRLKKTPCPRAPEHHLFEIHGPDDRQKPQRFIWRDADGKIVRQTKG